MTQLFFTSRNSFIGACRRFCCFAAKVLQLSSLIHITSYFLGEFTPFLLHVSYCQLLDGRVSTNAKADYFVLTPRLTLFANMITYSNKFLSTAITCLHFPRPPLHEHRNVHSLKEAFVRMLILCGSELGDEDFKQEANNSNPSSKTVCAPTSSKWFAW